MGFLKKKEIDEERSNENKAKMNALFQQVVEDADTYQVVYGFTSDVKKSNYVLATKTTFSYGSLIIGYRESDMTIVMLDTIPDFSGCGDAKYYRKSEIKKASFNNTKAKHVIQLAGGLFGEKFEFAVMDMNDYEHLAYIHQTDEFYIWYEFWQKFSA
ncbi:MAG: hypothetical protein RR585_03665 [Coprobacillus sp.]